MGACKEAVKLRPRKEYLITCIITHGKIPGMYVRTLNELRSIMGRWRGKLR